MDRNDPTVHLAPPRMRSHPEFDRRNPVSGTTIGPYRIIEELGRGGQGKVYLADDPRLKRKVALKVLSGLGSVPEHILVRFQREAEVASRLDHPGICAIYDAGSDRGVPYIAMRYVPGETLSALIRRWSRDERSEFHVATETESGRSSSVSLRTAREARTQVRQVLRIMRSAAMAVQAAHERGVIHRDLKPGNIMVTPEGEAVVLDFGLAQDLDSELPTLTAPGEFFGTPSYMAPEQISGTTTDARTDVWALGVAMYEALTLHRPFESPNRQAMYRGILSRTPTDPRTYNPGIPADLKVVLDKALEKEPQRRYQSMQAFADDLKAVLEDRPVAARPVSRVGRAVRWARREPAKAVLAATVAVAVPLAASLAGYLAARQGDFDRAEFRLRQDDLEAALERGFLHLGEGSPERSLEEFVQALSLDPTSFEAVAGYALALAENQRGEEALDYLDGVAVPGGSRAIMRTRAEVLCRMGRHGDEKALLRDAKRPEGSLDLFIYGSRALRRGHHGDQKQFKVALDAFKRAVLVAPRARALLHYQRAHAARHAGDAQAIRESIEALKALFPDVGRSWFWIGFALRERDPEESITAYERALELDPDLLMARANLGEVLFAVGRLADAESVLELARAQALAEDDRSTLARVYRNLGRICTRTERHDEAVGALERAVELRPNDVDYITALAHGLRAAGRETDAEARFEEAVTKDPDAARAWLNLGISRRRRGDTEGARAAYERALEERPGYAHAFNNLGNLDLDAGDLAGAEARYRQALEADPGLTRAGVNLGKLLERRRDLDGAIDAYAGAVKRAPTHGPAHESLTRLLHRAGRPEALRDEVGRWARRHRDDLRAWTDLTKLLLRFHRREDLRDPPETIKAARRALELAGYESVPHLLDLARALNQGGFTVESKAWFVKAKVLARDSQDRRSLDLVRRTLRMLDRE